MVLVSAFHEEIHDNVSLRSNRISMPLGPCTTKYSMAPWEQPSPTSRNKINTNPRSPRRASDSSALLTRSGSSMSLLDVISGDGLPMTPQTRRNAADENISPSSEHNFTPGSVRYELCQAELIPLRAELVSNVVKLPPSRTRSKEIPKAINILNPSLALKGRKSLGFLKLFKITNQSTVAPPPLVISAPMELVSGLPPRKTSLPNDIRNNDAHLIASSADRDFSQPTPRKVSFVSPKKSEDLRTDYAGASLSTLASSSDFQFPVPPGLHPISSLHLPISPPVSVTGLQRSSPIEPPPSLKLRPVSVGLKLDEYLPPSPISNPSSPCESSSPLQSETSRNLSQSSRSMNNSESDLSSELSSHDIMMQFTNARKSWQLKMWEMESEVRDLKLQISDLKSQNRFNSLN